jgi:kynurenine formamidase
MRLIDLTRTLDPTDLDRMPEFVRPLAAVLAPKIQYLAPDAEGRDRMCAIFGCTPDDLPEREGWGEETVTMNSHSGTHVDAPLHYGSTCEGRPARTITEIRLEELFCDGMVLDLRGRCEPGQGITVEVLTEAIGAAGRGIRKGDAVLLRTGQEDFDLDDIRVFQYPGMTRAGTLFLAEQGAKVLGTDALGWDRPFGVMATAFRETGNRAEVWDGHFAGRDREVFIVQQLANLQALPATGFKVGFFPIKLARASAAPARVVAFVPDLDSDG